MSLENTRQVIVLGRDDFSGDLARYINARRQAIEEAPIAVALVASNDGKLESVEKYFDRYPSSIVTILQTRAYEYHLSGTAARLKGRNQHLFLVMNQRINGQTTVPASTLAERLGADGHAIEVGWSYKESAYSALVQLLDLRDTPESDSHPPDLVGSRQTPLRPQTLRKDRHVVKPITPVEPHPLYPVWNGTRTVFTPTSSPKVLRSLEDSAEPVDSGDQPTARVKLVENDVVPTISTPPASAIQPSATPTSSQGDAPMTQVPQRTRATPANSKTPNGADGSIQTTLQRLQQRRKDHLVVIMQQVALMRADIAALAAAEQALNAQRQELEAELANLPAEILAGTTMPIPVNSEEGLVIPSFLTSPAAISSDANLDRSSKTYDLGYGCTVDLSGTRVRQLFEILVDSTEGGGKSYPRETLERQLDATSTAVYQTVADLRRQLRKVLGQAIADQCFTSNPHTGYRWESAPLASAAKTGT